MPKALSEKERAYVKQRLMEEAENCLLKYGVRKTTVDELVRRVHIPKGTFYLFYDSKELLFYDVLLDFHGEIQAELMKKLGSLSENVTPDTLTDIIFEFFKKVESSFLYPLMMSGEIELFMRKIPQEMVEAHASSDDLNVEQLVQLVPSIRADKVPHYSAALRAIFLSMLHKREVGEQVFSEALYILIRGVVMQMFENGEGKL
jgi:AcrR family transcriptional regulator